MNFIISAEMAKKVEDSTSNANEQLKLIAIEFEGFGKTFTDPIKKALVEGGDISKAFSQAGKALFERVAGRFLDYAFKPLETALETGLSRLFSGVANSIKGVGGGSGGNKGAVGSLLGLIPGVGPLLQMGASFLGFSRGGIVPQYFAHGGMARGTDTVPAMLTPGEMVLTKEQQAMMGNTYNIEMHNTISPGAPVGHIADAISGGLINMIDNGGIDRAGARLIAKKRPA